MRSGLYALVSLEGVPIEGADRARLGLPAASDATAPWAVHALDGDTGKALDVVQSGPTTSVLLGHLDEPRDLAAALGLPPATAAGALAAAAFERWGDAAPARLLGEWSFLRWDAAERTLVLMASETCRDPLFYALGGPGIAVAPDLRILSGLAWVGRTLDPTGLLFHMARAPLRRALTTETVVTGIQRVVQGTVVRVSAGRAVASTPVQLPPPQRWRGSFGDAMSELEAMLLRIVGQTIERHRQPAGLLSGGLDSSLLGYLAAQHLPAGRGMTFVTSAAAPDSGVTDETAYAALVAFRLGFPLHRVVPPRMPGVFRPSLRAMARATGPIATPAHYLYDALYDAAGANGADLLFDGVIGEATVSSIIEPDTRANALRRFARTAKRSLLGGAIDVAATSDDDNPFHPSIAPGLRRHLPPRIADLTAKLNDQRVERGRRPPSELFGYANPVRKIASAPTEQIDQTLRSVMPFRDRRLISLFAGMPVGFIERHGMTRAPARAILKNRVPDRIRQRIAGMPFAPDFDARYLDGLQSARARIELFRAAEIGAWLDLDWLAAAFDERPNRNPTLEHDFRVTMTAITAEYLLWWNTH